ncbi:phosphopyruvate hydratase [Jiangella anatolica]|uniref:Enolase n=1 Tax=Jiangella anatolica TaxID=2670374 RepID=A0A2W2BZK3_9ACTN|nr:phosphopyruvate hydratase [Jiangella anatolica]PZF85874.1 phosphopyruvate hydratase [Jiangella anatolica]
MTTISEVLAWEALDSRGRPTVGCRVILADGASGRATVPSGASTGGHEARERRDGDPDRYGGHGVRGAVDAVRTTLAPLVIGLDAADQEAVDAALESADDDPLLGAVGANAVLAVSLATLLAAAAGSGRPLWRHVSGDAVPLLPLPMVNIVSGGAHAGRALDIQDVLAVPVGATSFAQALEWVSRVRAAAGELLAQRGGTTTALVADEGGLAGGLADNEAALALVTDAVEHAGLAPGEHVGLAVDLAANQLHDGTGYRLDGETLDAAAWRARLERWCRDYPVVSLEDVLVEDDWAGWAAATPALGADRQLLGDDLFATNAGRLRQGIDQGVANAVLVKPNQAGTVSRARAVTELARAAGYATVISARSGDTEDDWLADLAVGWRTGQLKVGSTMRSERTAKWNRLLEIEATAGPTEFAGAAALSRSLARR